MKKPFIQMALLAYALTFFGLACQDANSSGLAPGRVPGPVDHEIEGLKEITPDDYPWHSESPALWGSFQQIADRLYRITGISNHIDKTGFSRSLAAYLNLKREGLVKRDVLVIVDYRKPSTQERFFVIDMKRLDLKFSSLVAHGRNSGLVEARRFSNRPGSFMSSMGVFLTGDKYSGRHGYSLNLLGLEKGINHLAYQRRIVIHGADYVSWRHIRRHGRLGRSLGCPALPRDQAAPIIDAIRDGSCLVILGNDEEYYAKSKFYRIDTPVRLSSVME